MTTITFYSYKGGVGRTLTLANLGRLLTQLRKRVFVLDLDLEAPGLHYKFGIEPTSGVLDCLTTTLESRAFPPLLSPYVVEVDGTHGLHLMAAGQAPSLAYWRRLSRLNWHDLLFGESAPGLPFFLELKQQILKQYSPDYLLIDARTGITEIGGVATTVLADIVVCLMVNNEENIDGSREVLRGILGAERPPGAPALRVIPVLCRVPKDYPSERELVAKALSELNEPGPNLGARLDLPALGVIHSRPEWQWSERVITQSPQEGDREMFLEYCDVFRTIFPDLAHLMLRFYQGGFEDFQASLAALKFDVTALLEDPMKGQPVESVSAAESALSLADLMAEGPDRDLAKATRVVVLARALHESGRLVEAVRKAENGAELFRALAERDPVHRSRSAAALNQLAMSLGAAGQLAAAADAGASLVAVYRILAQEQPREFLAQLAGSLNNLANRLSEAGQKAEALKIITESVEIFQQLTAENPNVFRPKLAMALNNQANRLGETGQTQDALAAIGEALRIRRELAQTKSDDFASDLARTLNDQANLLSAVGEREEALAANTESLSIWRALVTAAPDKFKPDIAMSLNNRANLLSELGRRDDALQAITEAVGIRREIAKSPVNEFGADLAMSLNNSAVLLTEVGRNGDALEAIAEAVDIRRRLAAAQPDAFRPDLAMSLSNHANLLNETGRKKEANEVSSEAVNILRELASTSAAWFRPELARALSSRASTLSELGRVAEALEANKEAIALRRELAEAQFGHSRAALAKTLNSQAVYLEKIGQLDAALKFCSESLGIFQELAQTQPAKFRPDLATCLGAMGRILESGGRSIEATDAFENGMFALLPLLSEQPAAVGKLFGTLMNNWAQSGRRAGLERSEDPQELFRQFQETIASRAARTNPSQ